MWQKADQVLALIQEHLARRPFMAPRDVYKLLYQGVRGPEHIIASPQVFAERLQAEWSAVEPADDDPLLESIHPDGALLRLNLRPFKAAGGDLKDLTAAYLETGQCAWGTQAELQMVWEQWVTACRTQSWPNLNMEALELFSAWARTQGFPAVHHSEPYSRQYRPAYRLVAVDIGLQLLPDYDI